MKKRNILWAAATLLLAACTQEETVGPDNGAAAGRQVQMTFTANAPAGAADTRTSLVNGTDVYWNSGDVIGVYSCTTNPFSTETKGSPFTTDLSASSPTATFTGTATEGAEKYVAVYPQDKFIACEWQGEDHYVLTYLLPIEQKAVPGSFDSGLNLSWAVADDPNGSLTFKNLCTLVKFRVLGEEAGDLKSVTLTDKLVYPLCGYCIYDTDADEFSDVVGAHSSSTVTLTGDFESEKYYYFVVQDRGKGYQPLHSGFYVTFTRKDEKTVTFKGSTYKPLETSTIFNLGTFNLANYTWETGRILNQKFIDAVDRSTGIDWEKDVDGYVLLTEENKAKMANITKLSFQSYFGELAELNYFTGLTSLTCMGCSYLTSLDVSYLTSLQYLECTENKILSSLNVSGLTQLEMLICYNNQLTGLDVSGLTSLTALNCSQNRLTELDITQLDNLNELYCGSQDIEGNMKLYLTQEQYDNNWGYWEYFNENVTPVILE